MCRQEFVASLSEEPSTQGIGGQCLWLPDSVEDPSSVAEGSLLCLGCGWRPYGLCMGGMHGGRREGEQAAGSRRALHTPCTRRGPPCGRRRRGAHRRCRRLGRRGYLFCPQQARARSRPIGPCGVPGNDGGGAEARALAAFRLHGLCDARALPHVRGPHGERPHRPLRLWGT